MTVSAIEDETLHGLDITTLAGIKAALANPDNYVVLTTAELTDGIKQARRAAIRDCIGIVEAVLVSEAACKVPSLEVEVVCENIASALNSLREKEG